MTRHRHDDERSNTHFYLDTAVGPVIMIENAFCRLKDFRRIATRYDKLAANFLSGGALATAIAF